MSVGSLLALSPGGRTRRAVRGCHHPLLGIPGLEQERGEGWVLIPERDLDAPEQKVQGLNQ